MIRFLLSLRSFLANHLFNSQPIGLKQSARCIPKDLTLQATVALPGKRAGVQMKVVQACKYLPSVSVLRNALKKPPATILLTHNAGLERASSSLSSALSVARCAMSTRPFVLSHGSLNNTPTSSSTSRKSHGLKSFLCGSLVFAYGCSTASCAPAEWKSGKRGITSKGKIANAVIDIVHSYTAAAAGNILPPRCSRMVLLVVAAASQPTAAKPSPASSVSGKHRLGFVSAACLVPHPEKAEKGGEDACFLADYAVGVADGVGMSLPSFSSETGCSPFPAVSRNAYCSIIHFTY